MKISVKYLLPILATVALGAWIVGCGETESKDASKARVSAEHEASGQEEAMPHEENAMPHENSETLTPLGAEAVEATTMDAGVRDAELAPAPAGGRVDVDIATKHGTLGVAPGVKMKAATFGGTVPGPVIHVKQGQEVRVRLSNDDKVPASERRSEEHQHSIDLHAAEVAPNKAFAAIAPDETKTFEFTASRPGAFLYHCGVAPAYEMLEHMGAGMYGAIIVDPAGGRSAAREFVLVAGGTNLGEKVGSAYEVDHPAMLSRVPTFTMFNGYADQYKYSPLRVRAGEPIRIYLINAGPVLSVPFHVIGTIFDRVLEDGVPGDASQGRQTYSVPPGGSAVYEFRLPKPGKYPFVSHDLSQAATGATGVIVAE